MAEIWPNEWLKPEFKSQVIAFLKHLPVDPRAKKNALYEWCQCSGAVMTAEDVEEVTGMKAGEI